jgi:hypothetical protein
MIKRMREKIEIKKIKEHQKNLISRLNLKTNKL